METQIMVYPNYTDKSLVVAGEGTRLYSDKLKELGGKFNPTFKGNDRYPQLAQQAGWVFPSKKQNEIMQFLQQVQNQQVQPTNQVSPEQLEYKSITYRVYQPEIGQKMLIQMSGQEYPYQVANIKAEDNNRGVIDAVYFQPADKIGTDQDTSKLVIVNGKWQVWGLTQPHEIVFPTRNTQSLAKFPTVTMPK